VNEFRKNIKYAGLILGVSLLIFLATGYGNGSYNWNTFYLFFMGAAFGYGVGMTRNKKKNGGNLKHY
jgi:hypothetical protein